MNYNLIYGFILFIYLRCCRFYHCHEKCFWSLGAAIVAVVHTHTVGDLNSYYVSLDRVLHLLGV